MHRTSPLWKYHQTKNVKSTKVEKAQFIHSRNISQRVQLYARYCATFWEPRNEGDSLCLPELPSASKNNEAYLKGQYNTVRTELELMTEQHVKQEKQCLSLSGGWEKLLIGAHFPSASAVGNGCNSDCWIDFLYSNSDFPHQLAVSLNSYGTSLCLSLLHKIRKIIVLISKYELKKLYVKDLKMVPSIS